MAWLVGWCVIACTLVTAVGEGRSLVHHSHRLQAHHKHRHRLPEGRVRHGHFRFPDIAKHLRRTPLGGSFLAARQATSCTLPQNLKFRPEHTETLVHLLSAHKPFTFVRFGDGDWFCALGGTGLDSNGVVLEKATSMCEALQSDIKSYGSRTAANFYPVLGSFFLCRESSPDMFAHVDAFFGNSPMQQSFTGFLNSDSVGFYFPLVPPPKPGRQPGVLPLLVGQTVVLVGPRHLGKLQGMLNYTAHVEVPPHSCWEARHEIIASIERESKHHSTDTVVFLVAGGIATRTMLYQTYLVLGQKDTFIDVGASLDGFAGTVSRDYNRNISTYCRDYPEYTANGVCLKKSNISESEHSIDRMLNSGMSKKADEDQDDDDDDDNDDDGDDDNDDQWTEDDEAVPSAKSITSSAKANPASPAAQAKIHLHVSKSSPVSPAPPGNSFFWSAWSCLASGFGSLLHAIFPFVGQWIAL